ncbi:chromate transporter [Enterococcus pseudoavium]|uniref:Chromate transporter n=1 Tax=Enterococcus pseudoavium TaxID=44007 RepID=A0AAE4I1J2_9ENTE|nr:chromate transporter [Enterococcus pseudoavium]MDT2737481.1 chromate transporter [Enterococcus pseudoavium]MDT2755648.1 chromate transporter [Enterococcus pseudoavium]MDT2771649.1 chromate transporter [Enterococcus pseudoavium]REC33014.1 chromate transporter [Enterococcus pseudoavium]
MQLFWTFFKIGLFSIGGGYAIIPSIQEQVVHQQGWLSQKVFSDIITISQMTPGPLAVNTSTFVGMQLNGITGAIVATIGCILGGCVISIGLYQFFQQHRDSLYVSTALKSLKAASVGLIMSAGFTILLLTFFGTSDFSINLFNHFDWKAAGLFLISLVLLRKFKTNPILLMCLAGIVGFLIY